MELKIRKITFKPDYNQAWITIEDTSEKPRYLGTWHVTDQELVEKLKERIPDIIKLEKSKNESKN